MRNYTLSTRHTVPLLMLMPAILYALDVVWGPAGVVGLNYVDHTILLLRFWRATVAALVGAMLGLAGFLLQYAVSNELASPDILGVLPGANAGVMLALILLGGAAPFGIDVAAGFVGGILAYLTSITLAARLGLTKTALVLSGLAVAGVASGLSAVLTLLASARYGVNAALVLLGSFAYSTREDALLAVVSAALTVLLALLLLKGLDAISYGDDVALVLGFNPKLVRFSASALSALLSAASVYLAGIVGFVSLIAPNLARLAAGGHPARSFAPSIALGAAITLMADLAGRVLGEVFFGGGEVPAGVLTTIVGGFFLAHLLVKTGIARG